MEHPLSELEILEVLAQLEERGLVEIQINDSGEVRAAPTVAGARALIEHNAAETTHEA